MNGTRGLPASGRERFLLALVSLSPILVFLLLRFLGYLKFARLALMAGAALAGATTLFLRPRWGLWVILFYVYAGMGLYFPINAAMPLTLVVLAAVILSMVRGEENQLNDALFWYASAFFTLVSLQSMLVAEDPALSFHELMNYLKMVLVTWLIVQLVRTPDDLRHLMYAVFAGAVATVFLGIMNIVLGIHDVSENYIGGGASMLRFSGAHENPNRAAAFMCSALPLGLFAVRHCARWLRPFFVAGIIILIVAIFATFSRSVVVAFGFVAVAVVLREVRSRRSYVAMVVLIAAGILLAPRYYWERVMGLRDAFETTGLDWSVYTRLLALRTAWEMFLDHPFTGIGLGNFIVAASHKVFLRIVVHNSYLEILVGTGVFGLLGFLAILASGLRCSAAGALHRWRGQPEWMRSMCFYFLLSGVSICLSAFFGTMPFRYPLWVPVAAGLVVGNLLRGDRAAAPVAAR